ncbi:MAG TPA: hypothetical protein VGY76_14155 [Solirubrobacteraceae bacterium]|nr:hypothetical protein [Solirubrobacteraceae bacterium]
MKRAIQLAGALGGAALLAAVFAATQVYPHLAAAHAATDVAANAASPVAATSSGTLTAGDSFVPDLGVPATNVVAFGASPLESPGEAWAYGRINGSGAYVLLEHADAGGWRVLPLPPSGEGGSLGAVELGPLGGEATAAGGVVLLTEGGMVIRDPGSSPRLVPTPAPLASGGHKGTTQGGGTQGGGVQGGGGSTNGGAQGGGGSTGGGAPAVLGAGESVPPSSPAAGTSTAYAAIDDRGERPAGTTGILIAPYGDGSGPAGAGILHYDGSGWKRESILIPTGLEKGFTPEALTCGGTTASPVSSSPENCWLLAAYRSGAGVGPVDRIALFRRVATGEAPGHAWAPAPVADPAGLLGTPAGQAGQAALAPLGPGAQMLTATAQGVWVDFKANAGEAQSQVSELVLPSSSAGQLPARAIGAWCYPTGPICGRSLGAELPAQYRSFAWAGSGENDPGTRILTGLPGRAMLELAQGSFDYVGDVPHGSIPGLVQGGAAFSSPRQGWIADGADRAEAGTDLVEGSDRAGQSQVIELTTRPAGNVLQSESVPFRRPLLAVAQAPGSTPGDPGAQAIAVGLQGQIGRFVPGQGWSSESLYDSAGKVQTPTLRGVAWPEMGRVYAVGDNGAMWLWRAESGLWEPDPAKPFNFIGDLTSIAFSPANPNLGYAVGKQGALLQYGKSWMQVALPAELQQANFTSVTFAGSEALATYRTVQGESEGGGIAVEDGSGWHVDPGVPHAVFSKIAGLADGGVVAAGPHEVLDRDSAGGPWRPSVEPPPLTQNVSALAAYRDSAGSVRAIISVDLDQRLDPNSPIAGPFRFSSWATVDEAPPSGPGQPPFFGEPDPLPATGYLLKETADGWVDMEHATLPAIEGTPVDQPVRPDPVLALLVGTSGASGLAVGGQTGDFDATPSVSPFNVFYQTAMATRFPATSASTNGTSPAPVMTTAGDASFVVAGQAACINACLENEGIGPEVWLTHALRSANRIATESPGGLRAFLYAGSANGTDLFARDLAGYGEPLTARAAGSASAGNNGASYYSFVSTGASGGPVLVVMLDYSNGALGVTQQEWLRQQLAAANPRIPGNPAQKMPAIVVGNASLGFRLPDSSSLGEDGVHVASDASTVSAILVEGGASAYFFDYPGSNVKTQVRYGTEHIPAFGSGTVGYVSPGYQGSNPDLLGSSGFLLADVPPVASGREVTAKVVPNIAQLSLDATDGVLLRRSQVALFEGLARRPPGGVAIIAISTGRTLVGPNPYDQIPFNCQGANCAYEVPTDYTFTSSNPDIGDFVAHEPGSANPRQVLLGANRLPVPDAHSGIFCAFNAGTTTVSITAGGLTYAEPIIVQAGSVQYPCGTVPLKNPPPAETKLVASFPVPALGPSSPPQANPQIQTFAPPPPPPLAAPPVHHARIHTLVLFPFIPLAAPALGARAAIVPPPGPPAARPIPPSGTSPVYQTSVAPQEKREEEEATSLVGTHEFAAYHPEEHSSLGPWALLALIVIAAGAGTGLRRGSRSRVRARPAYARARGVRSPRR